MTPQQKTALILLIQDYGNAEYHLGTVLPGDPDHTLRATNRNTEFGKVLDAVFAL